MIRSSSFCFSAQTGSQKDYVIVGSDSGRIVILEYNKEKNAFDKIHQETFGKSGCRRIVPGQVKWSPECFPRSAFVVVYTSLPVFHQMMEGNLSLIWKNVVIPGSVAFCFVHGPGL
jgi:hypothetical protein